MGKNPDKPRRDEGVVKCFFCKRLFGNTEQVARIRRPDGSKGFSHFNPETHNISECRLGGENLDTVEGWWRNEEELGVGVRD